MTIHLRSIGMSPAAKRLEAFPFGLPVVKKFRELKLRAEVTFLVGENGSGKSTLIEALAAAVGSVVVGGEDVRTDKTLAHARARLEAQTRLAEPYAPRLLPPRRRLLQLREARQPNERRA